VSALSSSPESVTCLVADDYPAVLRSICALLRSWGFLVVATTGDGAEAAWKIEELQPDLALLDLRMPGLTGIELAGQAASRSPATRVVFYTGCAEPAIVQSALDAGARGFIPKDAPLDDLQRALQIILAGGTYVDPLVTASLHEAGANRLTTRQRDILRGLAEGLSGSEVGKRLFVSHATVRADVGKAMAKLGARTRTEAVANALRAQLIA
jgi:DNA-binding NarL/FixJ family response regulator